MADMRTRPTHKLASLPAFALLFSLIFNFESPSSLHPRRSGLRGLRASRGESRARRRSLLKRTLLPNPIRCSRLSYLRGGFGGQCGADSGEAVAGEGDFSGNAKRERYLRRGSEESVVFDVLIIGGGAAGMSAARELVDASGKETGLEIRATILEARDRLGGRTHSVSLPARPELGLPAETVDLGANYIHGASKEHPVFQLAKSRGARLGTVAGGFWDSSIHCQWRHNDSSRVPPEVIAEVEWWRSVVSRYLPQACGLTPPVTNFLDAWRRAERLAKDAWCSSERKGPGPVPESGLKRGIYEKMLGKDYGYVANLDDLGIREREYGGDEEVEGIVGTNKSQERYHRFARSLSACTQSSEGCAPNVQTGDRCQDPGGDDLLMIDGYGNLMKSQLLKDSTHGNAKGKGGRATEEMESGIHFEINKTVTAIRVIKNFNSESLVQVECKDSHHSPPSGFAFADERESAVGGADSYTTTGEAQQLPKGYFADYVICTLPIGVLKSGRVEFVPDLSRSTRQAMARIGSGAHNKVILRFAEKDVFWPQNVTNFNSPTPSIQWLNLHAYGKTGVLVAHIWPPYAFGYNGDDDVAVQKKVLNNLQQMFLPQAKAASSVPQPTDTIITRWDTDPFSLGSYSYGAVGNRGDEAMDISAPHPPKSPRVFFAGEATSILGAQCVYGAVESGRRAAREVIANIKGEKFDRVAAAFGESRGSMREHNLDNEQQNSDEDEDADGMETELPTKQEEDTTKNKEEDTSILDEGMREINRILKEEPPYVEDDEELKAEQ